jgi:hypothetical protein
VTPSILRLLGILFMIAAAVVAVLNLHRVANLGLPWLTFLLFAFGLACMGLSSRLARSRR